MNKSGHGNPVFFLDVFAERKYAGNPLAVVRVEHPLSDTEMQQIAREINFSETTFIMSDKMERGGFPVRIFTPREEIPFAGHPTLGTVFVIQEEIIKNPVEAITLNLKAGQVPVTLSHGEKGVERLTMRQPAPVFGKIFEIEEIAAALSLYPAEIDGRFPLEEVSTGLPFIIIPLKDLGAVQRARVQRERYNELISGSSAKALFIFSPETYGRENDLNARMFADHYGIPEDPATGSANGCLAAYLLKHRWFGAGPISVRVEQGYEMGRPSLLYLEAREENGAIEVRVGGNVIPVAQGTLL